MKKWTTIVAGGFQVLVAAVLALVLSRMISGGGPLLWRVSPLPLALVGAAVVLGAVASCGLNGLRLLSDGRWLCSWSRLSVLSGVLVFLTVGILAADIVYTESRPRSGNARETALGRRASIAFTALDGRRVDLRVPSGKVTLVFCWATWCGPCKAEMPGIAALEEKLGPGKFEVVGINFDEDRRTAENFIRERKLRWPQQFEGKPLRENSFAAKYELTGIPQLWLVDQDGMVRDVEAYADLAAKVERLLAIK